MRRESKDWFPALMIYLDEAASSEEEEKLREYESSSVVKARDSLERLSEETDLFLHRVKNRKMAVEQQPSIIHSKDEEFSGKRILLVDDDARNTFALSFVLKELGVEVSVADNGENALERLGTDEPFDLVLMDMMMPTMDGVRSYETNKSQ